MGPAPEILSQNGSAQNTSISLIVGNEEVSVELTPKEYDDTVMEIRKRLPGAYDQYNLFYSHLSSFEAFSSELSISSKPDFSADSIRHL